MPFSGRPTGSFPPRCLRPASLVYIANVFLHRAYGSFPQLLCSASLYLFHSEMLLLVPSLHTPLSHPALLCVSGWILKLVLAWDWSQRNSIRLSKWRRPWSLQPAWRRFIVLVSVFVLQRNRIPEHGQKDASAKGGLGNRSGVPPMVAVTKSPRDMCTAPALPGL